MMARTRDDGESWDEDPEERRAESGKRKHEGRRGRKQKERWLVWISERRVRRPEKKVGVPPAYDAIQTGPPKASINNRIFSRIVLYQCLEMASRILCLSLGYLSTQRVYSVAMLFEAMWTMVVRKPNQKRGRIYTSAAGIV